MLERLELIMKAENMSQTQFADEININRSSMSHILNGRNNPSLDFIVHVLERFPKIQTDWLLFGKDTMYKSEKEDDNQQNIDLFTQSELTEKEEEIKELKLKIIDFKEVIDDFNNKIETLEADKNKLQNQLETLKKTQIQKEKVETIEKAAPTPPQSVHQNNNFNEITSVITLFSDDSFKIYKQK